MKINNYLRFTALCVAFAASQLCGMQKQLEIQNMAGSVVTVMVGLDGQQVVSLPMDKNEVVRLPFQQVNSLIVDRVDHTADVAAKAAVNQDHSILVKISSPESSGWFGWLGYTNPYRVEVEAFVTPRDEEEQYRRYGSVQNRFKDEFAHVINLLKTNPEREITPAEVLGLASDASLDQIKRMLSMKKDAWLKAREYARRHVVSQYDLLLKELATKISDHEIGLQANASADEIDRKRSGSSWKTLFAIHLSRDTNKNRVWQQVLEKTDAGADFKFCDKVLGIFNLVTASIEKEEEIRRLVNTPQSDIAREWRETAFRPITTLLELVKNREDLEPIQGPSDEEIVRNVLASKRKELNENMKKIRDQLKSLLQAVEQPVPSDETKA